jgi:3-oxoacid CoA-transferase
VKKVYPSAAAAVADVPDGARVMSSGFGLCGIPEKLIAALEAQGASGLTLISNNAGTDEHGMTRLLRSGQVRRVICTYVGTNRVFERMALAGEVELELVPQGTFAERMRAAGAGVPAFFTPTGYGTVVAEGKEVRWFGERPHLLEPALGADYALIKAWKGDPAGNLVFRRTARNFGPVMAMAARVAIAEVEELVPLGGLDPDAVVTPGLFVQRIVQGERYEKPLEPIPAARRADPRRERIARRAALEMRDGDCVNLGVGLPTFAAEFLPAGVSITLHSENGMLGVGPAPEPGQEDPDLINAGKEPVTERPGAAYFSSADSFAMIRGGHVDLAILGAFEVDREGSLANWTIPGQRVKGMGGAMDLVSGVRRVVVAMEHRGRDGRPKIVERCTLPLTGYRCVDLIVTEMAVLGVEPGRLVLRELAPGIDVEAVRAATGTALEVAPDLRPMPG